MMPGYHTLARRIPGTGSVTRNGPAVYIARLPREPGEKYGRELGRFETRYRANQALDRYWEEQRKAG